MIGSRRVIAAGLVLAMVLTSPAQAAWPWQTKAQATPEPVVVPASRWTAAWGSAQMIAEGPNAIATDDLKDSTLRQVVRITSSGSSLKIRLSNAFGTTPLTFGSIEIARSADPTTSRIDPDSRRTVTFSGLTQVTLPAGTEYVSDAIDLPVSALDDLVITTWQPLPPDKQTSHPGSRATSYLTHGNVVGATEFTNAQSIVHWYFIAGIDVETTAPKPVVVIVGDSITDGYGVQPNTNARWPDTLMRRLKAASMNVAVINKGIGGNRLLLDGLGPNASARFERDVLSLPGVTHIILFEGVNDLGTLTRDAPATPEAHAALVRNMITSYQQIIDKAHAHGLKIYGATITPFGGNGYYHPDSLNEADRQAINAWIRTPGNFDAVIDFDALTRDPNAPDRLNAQYDSGDGLHPSIAGYEAMGTFIDLELFK